jgi:hypothetical protein
MIRLASSALQDESRTPPEKLTRPFTPVMSSVPAASVFQPPKLCPAMTMWLPLMKGCRTITAITARMSRALATPSAPRSQPRSISAPPDPAKPRIIGSTTA